MAIKQMDEQYLNDILRAATFASRHEDAKSVTELTERAKREFNCTDEEARAFAKHQYVSRRVRYLRESQGLEFDIEDGG